MVSGTRPTDFDLGLKVRASGFQPRSFSPLRVQVPDTKIHTHTITLNPKYLAIGYLDPLGLSYKHDATQEPSPSITCADCSESRCSGFRVELDDIRPSF